MNAVCFDCGRSGPWQRRHTQAIRCGPCRAAYERWRSRAYKTTPRRGEKSCDQCGATKDLTTDHIRPISRGGTNAPENLRTLCRRCNSARGNR